MRNPFSSRIRVTDDLCAILLLAGVTLAVFWPWICTGQAFYWGDIGLYFAPMTVFLQAALRHGHIPLWNPEILCGTPFAGNPQMSVLYPENAILPYVNAHLYVMIMDVTSIFFAGVFFYRFLTRGRLRLWWVPGVFGAIVFMLGGFVVSKAQFPNMLAALAFMPLCLLQAERLVRNPGVRQASYLGLAVGIQLLAAHAQITLMTLYMCALVAMTAGKWGRSNARIARLAAPFSFAGLVALGLDAVNSLPIAQLWTVSSRQQLSLDAANRFHLYGRQWTNFFLPLRFGHPYLGTFAPAGLNVPTYQNFWETACYIGIVPTALVVTSLLVARRKRIRATLALWFGVAGISIWLSLGAAGHLYTFAYFLLPGIKAFHDPARFLLLAAFAFPVICAVTLDRIMFRPKRRQALALVFAAVCVAGSAVDLGAFDRNLYPLKPISQIEGAARQSRLVSALIDDPILHSRAGRTMMLDSNGPWTYFTSYRDYHQHEDGFLVRRLDTSAQNLLMGTGVMDAGGYEPIGPKASISRFNNVRASHTFDAVAVGRMAVSTVIAFRPHPLPSSIYLVRTKSFQTSDKYNNLYYYKDLAYLPRVRFVEARNGGVADPKVNGVPSIALDTPNKLIVVIPTSVRARTLVLADSAYPGWHATLAGTALPVWPTSDGFRKLRVPPTTHSEQLEFTYEPVTFILGLYITLFTAAFLVAVMTCGLVRRRTPTDAPVKTAGDGGWLFPTLETRPEPNGKHESLSPPPFEIPDASPEPVAVGTVAVDHVSNHFPEEKGEESDLIEWRPGDFALESEKAESQVAAALRNPKKRFKPFAKERGGNL